MEYGHRETGLLFPETSGAEWHLWQFLELRSLALKGRFEEERFGFDSQPLYSNPR